MTPAPKPIRVAIAGYGLSGRLSHADPIRTLPDLFEICGVCDLNPDRRKEACDQIGCPVTESFDELLEAGRPELVSIITRSDTHCAMAIQALRAGIHTLVTKPWALNLEEGLRILDASRQGGAMVFPWIPMLWSPDFRQIRKWIREGAIGDVFLLRRYITHFFRREDWQTRVDFGGGYLLNWGAHIVQPLMELAESPVSLVFGQMGRVVNPGDAEDHFSAFLEFENGMKATAEFTQAQEGLPGFMIQGTRGMILSNDTTATLIQKDPAASDKPLRRDFPLEGKLFGDETEIYRDVAVSIRNHAPFPATPEIALEGTRVLDAIRRSSECRQATSLPPLSD